VPLATGELPKAGEVRSWWATCDEQESVADDDAGGDFDPWGRVHRPTLL